MKDLKTYIVEGLKPPRLSAKNRDLWKNGLVDEEKIMEWLKENCWITGKIEIVHGKINVKGDVAVDNNDIEFFPYPFGNVTGYFNCSYCKKTDILKRRT